MLRQLLLDNLDKKTQTIALRQPGLICFRYWQAAYRCLSRIPESLPACVSRIKAQCIGYHILYRNICSWRTRTKILILWCVLYKNSLVLVMIPLNTPMVAEVAEVIAGCNMIIFFKKNIQYVHRSWLCWRFIENLYLNAMHSFPPFIRRRLIHEILFFELLTMSYGRIYGKFYTEIWVY